MILKKKINFAKFETFNKKKLSANAANTTYTEGFGGEQMIGLPDIMWQTICFIKDEQKFWTGGQMYDCSEVDLSEYMKSSDAEKTFIPKLANDKSTISISNSGSFNNYGDNGQAFNAVRDLTGTTKYLGTVGSKFPLNAASFGVKDNGTTAFTHKKYDTFNKTNGTYTGAKNTAVLMFSGNSGLLYAKNTGTASDVTDSMYKYVGVIDSVDDKQKVYSSAQTDGITNALAQRITDLEGLNQYLMNVITLLIEKTGITDEELSSATEGLVAQQSLSDIENDVHTEIKNNTTDYSQFSDEESNEIV